MTYSFADPVNDPNMFCGYGTELKDICMGVAASHQRRRSFFVAGAGMGKSSMLRQIKQCLRLFNAEQLNNESGQWLIPLDLSVLEFNPFNFFGKVAEKLYHDLSNNPLPLSVPSEVGTSLQNVGTGRDQFGSFVRSLSLLVKETQRASSPTQLRLVLLIDDLWRGQNPKTINTLDKKLLKLYREASLEHAIAYVITGGLHETRDLELYLEGILVNKDLHVFDKEQSMELVNKAPGVKIPEAVAKEIYAETGGHPALIQYIMSKICDKETLEQLKVEDMAAEGIQEIIKKIYLIENIFSREHPRHFDGWWQKLSELDRKVYYVFCKSDPQFRTLVDNLARMRDISTAGQVDRKMIQDSLRMLMTFGMIRECSDPDGIYELAGKWPGRWFRQMKYTHL